jgi:hypothetical protein
MDAVEFDIRIDYYKGSPETSGNYAGSMSKEGFQAAQAPRVGEHWLHATGWLQPTDLVEIVKVTHGFSPDFSDPLTGEQTATSPHTTIVVHQQLPGSGEMAQFLGDFQQNGWRWFDGQRDPDV